LIKPQPAPYGEEQVFAYLSERRNQIQALVISGGEPTLWEEDLLGFLGKTKQKFPTLLLKLDTNGSHPGFLERCLFKDPLDSGKPLIDFVALDYKSFRYDRLTDSPKEEWEKSLRLLHQFPTGEVRITMYPPFVPEVEFSSIAAHLSQFLIPAVAIQLYQPQPKTSAVAPYKREVFERFQKTLRAFGLSVIIRPVP